MTPGSMRTLTCKFDVVLLDLNPRRLDRAKDLLMVGRLSIAEIALETGFSHQSHLARHLRRSSGLSPRAMKRLFSESSSIELK